MRELRGGESRSVWSRFVGVSATTVQSVEEGKHVASLEYVIRACKRGDRDIGDIVRELAAML